MFSIQGLLDPFRGESLCTIGPTPCRQFFSFLFTCSYLRSKNFGSVAFIFTVFAYDCTMYSRIRNDVRRAYLLCGGEKPFVIFQMLSQLGDRMWAMMRLFLPRRFLSLLAFGFLTISVSFLVNNLRPGENLVAIFKPKSP